MGCPDNASWNVHHQQELLLVSEGASLPLVGGQSSVRLDPPADWMRSTHFREANGSTFTQSLPVQMFISPHYTILETSRIMCDQVCGYGGLVKLTHRLYCPMQCARLGTLPESTQNPAGAGLSFIWVPEEADEARSTLMSYSSYSTGTVSTLPGLPQHV